MVCICVDVTENSGLEVDAIKLKAWPVISVQMRGIDAPCYEFRFNTGLLAPTRYQSRPKVKERESCLVNLLIITPRLS